MKQEDRELLLKDLCARQPHGVILKTPQGDGYLNEVSLSIFGHELGVNIKVTERTRFKLEECKPYLRPMSSMTKAEKKKFDDFCVIDEFIFEGNSEIGHKNQAIIMSGGIDYLNSIHVDYRGLIPRGLAIAVTDENNPYKD